MSRKPGLTQEQETVRLQGLRALARMIARRRLAASGAEDDREDGDSPGNPVGVGEEAAGDEEESVSR